MTKRSQREGKVSVVFEDTRNEPDEASVEVSLSIRGGEDTPLHVLGGIKQGLKHIDESIRAYVASARDQGHTWEEIGDALGVTRQSVWEKYSNE